MSPVMEIRFAV